MAISIKDTIKTHLVDDFGVQNDSGTLKFPVTTTVAGQISDLEADVTALQGKNFFAKADLALTGMPAYTYDNGTAGVGATITVDANGAFEDSNSDGVQLQVNDRVFIRSEYSGVADAHEGIYDVTAVGDGSNPAVFTRATDADESAEFLQNKTLYVGQGDTHSGHVYAITSGSNPVMGTDAINWEEKSETPAVGDGSIGTANLANNAVTYAKIHGDEQAKLDKANYLTITGAFDADQAALDIAANSAKISFDSASSTKLGNIEENATADQTGAEIKAAYEAEADTNAFTDAEQSKLSAIEANATADQTGAEIKAAYEAEADTNAYVDADKAKMDFISVTQAVDLDTMESDIAGKMDTFSWGDGLDAGAVDISIASTSITLSGVDTATNVAGYQIVENGGNKVQAVFSRQSGFDFYIKSALEAGAKITLSGMSASKFDVEYEIIRWATGAFTTSDNLTWNAGTSNSNPDFPMAYYNSANDYLLAYDTTNDEWRVFDLSDATGDTDLVLDMVSGERDTWVSVSFTLSGVGQSESLGSGAHEDITDEIYDIPASSITQVSHTGSGDFPYYLYQTAGGSQLLAFNVDTGRWVAIQPTSTVDYSTTAITEDAAIAVSGSTTYGNASAVVDGSDDYGNGINIPPAASSSITYVNVQDGHLEFSNGKLSVAATFVAEVDANTAKVSFDSASSTKVGYISVTQAVDLDSMESDLSGVKTKADHLTVTQAVDLDTMESDLSTTKGVTDGMTAPGITSSTTGSGTNGVEVSYTATSTKTVLWSIVDTDTTGYSIDMFSGVLEGTNPAAGTYDIELYAFDIQTRGISQQTVTFTIS